MLETVACVVAYLVIGVVVAGLNARFNPPQSRFEIATEGMDALAITIGWPFWIACMIILYPFGKLYTWVRGK